MLIAKQFADLITVMRFAAAFILPWLGLTQGADGLPLAVWLMIADWTGDCLDGPLARRSRVYHHTWVGDHDLEVDMAVSGGLLVYLVLAGQVDARLAAVYLLIWGLIFWRWGVPKALGMLVQAPIYGGFIWVALRDASATGLWIVAWILAAIVVTWPKFPREVAPGFVAGMRQVWKHRHGPRGHRDSDCQYRTRYTLTRRFRPVRRCFPASGGSPGGCCARPACADCSRWRGVSSPWRSRQAACRCSRGPRRGPFGSAKRSRC
jgi:hypothetical protein